MTLNIVSCNSDNIQKELLVEENKSLKREIDSLNNELNISLYGDFWYPEVIFQNRENLGEYDTDMLYCDMYGATKLIDKKVIYSVYY